MTDQNQQTQPSDTWSSPKPKQPVGNTTWGPPAYEEPDDTDSVDELPTLESLTREVRSLASSHVDFENQVDGMVRDHRINSHAGAGATDSMKDEIWSTQLQHLDRQETALIANIRKEEQKLQALHASISALDSAEDVDVATYAEAASVLTFVAPQVAAVKRADALADRLRSVASRGNNAQTLAWRQAAQSWLQSNGHVEGAATVRRVVDQLSGVFTSNRASDLRSQHAEASRALSGTRMRIERARQARGRVPDFLEGALEAAPRDPSDRKTGYE